MLDSIASSLITWFNSFQNHPDLKPLESLRWENSTLFQLPPPGSDRHSETIVEAYLQNLKRQGIDPERQGIWVQSDWVTPVSNRGKVALPAASLTKIATTLASLSKWGAKHQFITNIYVTGEINAGIVMGDLIVEGSGDPFFVWEEAIALANTLNQLGISEVRGNLLVTDKFYMNYQNRALEAGELFKQGLNRQWQLQVSDRDLQMPPETKQSDVAIAGEVKAIEKVSSNARLLIAHQSLPLAEILRQMNIYSNNKMAQILADLLGGAGVVAQTSADIAGFDPTEIELVNGSGLSEENRISPHAVCQMLMAIDRLLQKDSFNAADLFPTAGKDVVGTVQGRSLPTGTTIKTGTLNNVSALAGIIPTSNRGNVYFSIINYGDRIEYFRQQQDILLNQLTQPWQLVPNNFNLASENWYLGDPQRNYFYLDN